MEEIWERIEGLARTVHGQGERIDALEKKNAELEIGLANVTGKEMTGLRPSLAHLQGAEQRQQQQQPTEHHA